MGHWRELWTFQGARWQKEGNSLLHLTRLSIIVYLGISTSGLGNQSAMSDGQFQARDRLLASIGVPIQQKPQVSYCFRQTYWGFRWCWPQNLYFETIFVFDKPLSTVLTQDSQDTAEEDGDEVGVKVSRKREFRNSHAFNINSLSINRFASFPFHSPSPLCTRKDKFSHHLTCI